VDANPSPLGSLSICGPAHADVIDGALREGDALFDVSICGQPTQTFDACKGNSRHWWLIAFRLAPRIWPPTIETVKCLLVRRRYCHKSSPQEMKAGGSCRFDIDRLGNVVQLDSSREIVGRNATSFASTSSESDRDSKKKPAVKPVHVRRDGALDLIGDSTG